MRIPDHARFDMESSVANEKDGAGVWHFASIFMVFLYDRASAAQDFSRGSRPLHRDHNVLKALLCG